MTTVALPDAVRVPCSVGHGDTATEKSARGARCRQGTTEEGRTERDWDLRRCYGAADADTSLWSPGHVSTGSEAFCRPRKLHAQPWTVAQQPTHLPVYDLHITF